MQLCWLPSYKYTKLTQLYTLDLHNVMLITSQYQKQKHLAPAWPSSNPTLHPNLIPLRAQPTIPRHPTFRFLTGTAGSEKKLWRKVISIPASFTRSSRSSRVFMGMRNKYKKTWVHRGVKIIYEGTAILNLLATTFKVVWGREKHRKWLNVLLSGKVPEEPTLRNGV